MELSSVGLHIVKVVNPKSMLYRDDISYYILLPQGKLWNDFV